MRNTALVMLLALAACSSGGNGGGGGGGGSTPTPTPTPANAAPSFTSGTAATIAENTAAAYQAAATDPNGDPVTFSIAGGADAARFTITGAGALSFAPAPNFDLPADADANNVYAVQLRVSDGTLSSTLDLNVTVTNSREGIRVRRVGTGFDQPIYVAPIPGSADVFVAEKTGGIWRLNPATGAKTLAHRFVNLSTDGERGLLGLALTPNFATSNIALAVATAANGAVEVRRFAMGTEDLVGLPGYMVALSVPHPGANNHNGSWIGYGPDGHVYVTVGDGGGAGDPGNNAQNPASRLGKVLRLANNPDPFAGASPQYFMPAPGNPYIAGGGDPYVYALGLRNPFRASFGTDGRLYIGDVGQGALEEIDVISTTQPGLNFGWRFFEGTNAFTGTPPAGFVHTQPVTQYGRALGGTVIGGYVYRGPITSLLGSYVFGDFISGTLWSLPATSLVQGTLFPSGNYERRNLDFAPDAGAIDQLVSFGEDNAGNLYFVDIAGEIFMAEPG
jgi:glucose/arabinose dehydrogenase